MTMLAPDPLCALALSLTTLLAMADRSADISGGGGLAWMPFAALAVLASGSGVLGVIDPESLAIAFGTF